MRFAAVRVLLATVLMTGCKGEVELLTPEPAPGQLAIPVRVVLGEGIDVDAASAVLSEAQVFLAGCGLTMEGVARPIRVNIDDLFPGRVGEVAEASETLLPLRAFLKTHGAPGKPYVNLVLLKRLVPPGGVATRILGELDGLGLPPYVESLKGLGIPTDFTPSAFATLDAETIAHELGHALGLEHRDGLKRNLMQWRGVRQPTCVLDDGQLEMVRAAVELRKTLGVKGYP